MRPIKFRAWDGKKMYRNLSRLDLNKDGAVEPCYWPKGAENETKLGCTHKNCNLKPYYQTVQLIQFTGLKDKNNKEIYEGDIVDVPDHILYVVGFRKGAFVFQTGDPIKNRLEEFGGEVIGNIYENKELLKEQINEIKHK